MSREIKFRIWDTDLKNFNDSWDNWEDESEELYSPPRYLLHGALKKLKEQTDRYIVEQFTGLFDINGIEVFEGDIVEYAEGVELGDKQVLRGVVVYDEYFACFGYAPKVGADCWNYPWEGTANKPKVLGNIHENRDLLKSPTHN